MDFPTGAGAHFPSSPTGPAHRQTARRPLFTGRKFPMSRIRLLALLATCLVVLAFTTSAMAASGGSSGDDSLKGSGRADTMQLRGGDDSANGGAGDDRMFGGAGDDPPQAGGGGGPINEGARADGLCQH